MTKNLQRVLWLLSLFALLMFAAFTFATTDKPRRSRPSAVESNATKTMANPSSVKRSSYVRRNLLSPKLVQNLNALGDRLEKPGKERLSVTGTLSRAIDSQTEEVMAVFEFPDRLHLKMQKGNQKRVIDFDGAQAEVAENSLNTAERELLETLLFDTAEHFFAAQMQGKAMRFLGARFRTDDGSNPDYRGPHFDVYKIADQIDSSGQERPAKLYYFNSDTLMLERVTYVINRDGSEVNVETRLSDWREVEGQRVARRIERTENGRPVLALNIRSAQPGARANDNLFAQ